MPTIFILEFARNLECCIRPFVRDDRETNSIVSLVLEEYLQISRVDFLLNKKVEISTSLELTIYNSLQRIALGEPVQYVLGYAHFLGKKFSVNKNVLIPRQETEGLVELVMRNNNLSDLKILDLCTGSGCIAVSLCLGSGKPIVHGLDVDADVLSVAEANAKDLGASVYFFKQDILEADSLPGFYDIMVSNPPYVLEEEKAFMARNVLDYEPHKALFVPTDDPLNFYKKIAKVAKNFLNPQGKLYFEINERFGSDICDFLMGFSFETVHVFKDIHDKDRFVEAII